MTKTPKWMSAEEALSHVQSGMSVERAVQVAMIEPLTDDAEVRKGLWDIVTAVLG